MALVRVVKDDITGIMIDGFISNVNSLKPIAMEIKDSKSSSWYFRKEASRFLRSLRKNNLTNNSLYHHFGIMKHAVIYSNCPIMSAIKGNDSWRLRCWQKAYTIGNYLFSMEGKTKKWVGNTNVKEISEILKTEFDNIRISKPNTHYLQNIVIYQNISRYPCSLKDGCCNSWANQMNFDVKPTDSYVDFSSFQMSWSLILEQKINRYKEKRNIGA